jgi:hypothetical protein
MTSLKVVQCNADELCFADVPYLGTWQGLSKAGGARATVLGARSHAIGEGDSHGSLWKGMQCLGANSAKSSSEESKPKMVLALFFFFVLGAVPHR